MRGTAAVLAVLGLAVACTVPESRPVEDSAPGPTPIVKRTTIGELPDIEAALEAMRRCIAKGGLGADEDIAFHIAVAQASENDYFVRTINSVTRAIRIGISIAVNREPRCRCARVDDPLSAQLAREHNDANVIAMGGRLIGHDMARACVTAFLGSDFAGGRHQRRVDQLSQLLQDSD